MKVLMLGWEFPPHITGGLATACAGLCEGLHRHGVEVTFVIPRAHGDEDQRFARVIGCNEVEVDDEIEAHADDDVEPEPEPAPAKTPGFGSTLRRLLWGVNAGND